MKKTTFSFLLVLISAASFSQGLIDTFKLDYKNSLGQKAKTLMVTQAILFPIFGQSGSDTTLKVHGTSKVINDELFIVDRFGHYTKAVKPDSSSLATKFELSAKVDTVNKLATKTDLKGVTATVDTINKIATKSDIAGVLGAAILDTAVFVNRSMNLSDIPDKAAARANLGITGTGGGSGSFDSVAAYDVAPTTVGKNFYLNRATHKLGVLIGGKWLYFSASDSVSLAAVVNQNLLTFSEQFDDASWTKVGGGTITANTTVAPDGTTSGDTYKAGVGAYAGILRKNFIYSNGTYTGSVYLKYNNWRTIGLRVGAGAGGSSELWGTNTPFVDLIDVAAYPAGNNVSIHVVSAGGGWVRMDLSFTIAQATGVQDYFDICIVDNNGEISTARDGTEKVEVWGADLNTGTLKNYSKTTTTANP